MTAPYGGLHFELGIRDLTALAANFHAADEQMMRDMLQLVQETAGDIHTLAEMLAAKRTGFMADHIKEFFTPSGLGFEVGWDVADFVEAGFAFYPFFVEFGTIYMNAQPALGPAADTILPGYVERVSDVLLRSIRRLERRNR